MSGATALAAGLRAEAMQLISDSGAEFEDLAPGGDPHPVAQVWAPSGRVWRSNNQHLIAMGFAVHDATGWHSLIDELREGTKPCPEKVCEVCDWK